MKFFDSKHIQIFKKRIKNEKRGKVEESERKRDRKRWYDKQAMKGRLEKEMKMIILHLTSMWQNIKRISFAFFIIFFFA